MKKVDYIVVGLGIAGIAFCEKLVAENKTFVVFDSGERNATSVAAGTINPTVLKRFTAVWNVEEFLPQAKLFFKQVEQRMGVSFSHEAYFYRIFNSAEEQNDWMVASDKQKLAPYFSSEIVPNENPQLIAPFGLGSVTEGVKVNTPLLVAAYKKYLQQQGFLKETPFQYDDLTTTGEAHLYGEIKASNLVFAEGVGALQNPYYQTNWLLSRKGQYMVFKAPNLKLDEILKGPHFLIPQGNDLYKIGATLDREDQTSMPTEKAKQELIEATKKMIHCPFEVVSQSVGFRPTTKDRRPILGPLPTLSKAFVLNGLGTRGIMGAATLANILYQHIEYGEAIPKEMDIQRTLKKPFPGRTERKN